MRTLVRPYRGTLLVILLAMVVQQQLADVGIALDVRSYEFATFYADISRGVFQMAP